MSSFVPAGTQFARGANPCLLSSLPGLNRGAAFIPFSFVPAGLDRSALLISEPTVLLLTFDACGVAREMRTISGTPAASAALSKVELHGQSRPPGPPRPPCPPCPPCPQRNKIAGETPALQEESMPSQRPALPGHPQRARTLPIPAVPSGVARRRGVALACDLEIRHGGIPRCGLKWRFRCVCWRRRMETPRLRPL